MIYIIGIILLIIGIKGIIIINKIFNVTPTCPVCEKELDKEVDVQTTHMFISYHCKEHGEIDFFS